MTKEPLAFGGDIISASVLGLSLMEFLPPIAAILSIMWLAIRIWESETVKKITGRFKEKNDGTIK